MRISNVGMFVTDLEAAKNFFVEYFNAQVHCEYNEEENNYYSYILKFDEGPKLELMNKPGIVDQEKDPNRTGFAHLCIKVDSREQLDDITARFHAAGYHFFYEPATNGGKEIRCITFEGNVLEVCC